MMRDRFLSKSASNSARQACSGRPIGFCREHFLAWGKCPASTVKGLSVLSGRSALNSRSSVSGVGLRTVELLLSSNGDDSPATIKTKLENVTPAIATNFVDAKGGAAQPEVENPTALHTPLVSNELSLIFSFTNFLFLFVSC